MKKTFVFTILFALIFGCENVLSPKSGGSSSKSKASPITSEPESKTDELNSATSGTKDKVQAVFNEIEGGDIDKEIGLEEIKTIISEDQDNATDSELEEIANLLTQVSGESSTNMALLMGLDSIETTEDSIEGLNLVYGQLIDEVDSITAKMDRVLLYYINNVISKYHSTNAARGDVEDIIYYYEERVNDLVSSGAVPGEVFSTYSMLHQILPTASTTLFKEIFPSVELKITSPQYMQLNYTHSLNAFLAENEIINIKESQTIFTSALNNVKWSMDVIEKNNISISDLLNTVSSYYSLFDLSISDTDKKAVLNQTEKRFLEVSNKFQKVVQRYIQANGEKSVHLSQIHPYAKIYINKALINLNRIPFFYNDKSIEADYLAEVESDITKFSGATKRSKASDFIKNYYRVEAKRHLIELSTFKTGVVRDAYSKNILTYHSLMSSLLNSLFYVYDKNISRLDLQNDSNTLDLFQSLGEEYDKLGNKAFKINYCKSGLENCKTKILKAGIYSAPVGSKKRLNLELYGESILFTPLSMIHSNGSDVFLGFTKIENAWIDTNGKDGKTKAIPQSQNKVKFPSFVKVDRKLTSKKPGIILQEHWNYFIVNSNPTHPQAQMKSSPGFSSGKITFNLNRNGSLVNTPLLSSFGGQGGQGSIGLTPAPANTQKIKRKKTANSLKFFKTQIIKKNICTTTVKLMSGDMHYFKFHTEWKYLKNLTKTKTYKMNRGKGGQGGNAGNGTKAVIRGGNIQNFSHLLNAQLMAPGRAGSGGAPGACGHGVWAKFKGAKGAEGKIVE